MASAVVAACHRPAQEGRPGIEVIVPTEAATLDPRFATRSLDVKLTRLIHAGLVGLDETTLEPVPLVAERLDREDDRTVRVTLRDGVTFHSGRALTPEDVCATLAAVRDPALGSPHRGIVEAVARCEQTGPREIVIAVDRPRATLLTDLELPILRRDQVRSPPRPDGELDGLGPFALASLRPGEVSLVPARTGVGAPPRHPVVVRTIRDENARVARLLSGRSDVAPNAISPPLLPALADEASLEIVARPGANVTYLLFQNDRAPLVEQRVRHAIASSLDRGLVVRTLLAGRGEAATSLLPPGHWAASRTPAEPFAPEVARAVLAPLGPTTLLTSTERSRVTIARALAQMMGDAGLQVTVVPLELGVLLGRLDAGDFDMAVLQIPELTEPNVLSWFFHPRGIPGEGAQGKNRARYRSREAGELLDQASASMDRDTRRGAYARLAELMAKDLPVVPLWHEDQVAVVSARARGFFPSAEGRWGALSRLE